MRVLVCGASGFIGQAICDRFTLAGHQVIRGVRHPVGPADILIDYATDTDCRCWAGRLEGIDVVVNAVGIITESPSARFDDIHHRAPAALFAACLRAGVRRVIQISALGAERGDTPYFRSKHAADRFLSGLPLEWQILRPSLVHGQAGGSAALFRMLASLPVIPVPDVGQAIFQPIHIDDLAEGVLRAAQPTEPAGQQVDMVGASSVSFRAMLEHYRRAMGLGEALYLKVPARLMGGVARLSAWLPGASLTPDTWRMLRAGNAGSMAGTTRLLGHPPRRIEQFMAPAEAELLGLRALAAWQSGLLRHALAWVWIATAWVSLMAHPVAESLALLGRAGISGWPAILALHAASVLDLAMGVACIRYPGRALWGAQAALVIAYTGIIVMTMPEFLTHPFGPVLKNLPILAILFILSAEPRSWTI